MRNAKQWKLKFVARKLHRWMGLFAFWWLATLGVTGIFLDHPEWRWQHQTLVAGLTTPENPKNGQHLRHPRDWTVNIAINPQMPDQILSGGPGGLWQRNAEQDWQPVSFEGLPRAPMIYALTPSSTEHWQDIWIATDDGIWRYDTDTRIAQRLTLKGKRITSLSFDMRTDQFLAVINKSKIVQIPRASPEALSYLDLSDISVQGLPKTVSLNRWGFDLHLGTGFFAKPFSIFANDFAGIAMAILSISGFLYWFLPKHWSKRKTKLAAKAKKKWMVGLYRTHVFFFGLFIIVPLVYLSATGIFLGHKSWFQSWSENIELPHAYIPGDYDLSSLAGEIETALPVTQGDVDGIHVLTRMGLLRSEDKGRTWTYDDSLPFNLGKSWNRLKYFRTSNSEVISDVIGRNFIRRQDTGIWTPITDTPGYVILSLNQTDERHYIHTLFGLYEGDFDTQFAKLDADVPQMDGLDVAFIMRTVHGVLVFNKQLVWFNDAMAIIAFLMSLTGLTVWLGRNKKWM